MQNIFEGKQNSNSLLVECEKCKNKFEINVNNGTMKLKEKFEADNGPIFLSYYVCLDCGKYHYVQIDDKNTLHKFNELQKQFIKLAATKRKGKVPPQSQVKKFKKSHADLVSTRRELMEEYEGCTLLDKSNKEFTLRFSQ